METVTESPDLESSLFGLFANDLITKTFKQIGPLNPVDEFDGKVLAILNGDNERPNLLVQSSPHFARYIPIIEENVSTKKHEYRLKTHVVFWLADNNAYIFTPPPSVKYVRVGRSLKEHKLGSDLMIPHNCNRYSVIALRQGCKHVDDKKVQFTDIVVTNYKV